MIDAALSVEPDRPGSSLDGPGPAPLTQAALMPGSRHAPTARPACDTVTAGPGQSLLAPAGGGHSSPAAALPQCRSRAALPAAGRPGPDDDREPARVTTTAGAQDEPSKAMAADLRHQAQREARVRADRGDDDPRSVAAAFSRRDSRRPAGWAGCRPAAAGLLPASQAPMPAPLRIRLQHMNIAKITSASPKSIRHRKARAC